MPRNWDAVRLLLTEVDAHRVNEASHAIQPILYGLHPAEQGAIIADLLAIWLTGHAPENHEQLIVSHLEAVLGLIPLYMELRGENFTSEVRHHGS